jgi:NAD(P)-dependent dehydrogenase (short-subunit alcohol dehydrogenase family)
VGAKRDFKGKCVVVTGAAGGMGQAFCRRFGAAGAKLGLLDLESEALRSFEKELTEQQIDCVAVACDVSKEGDCRAAISSVIESFGGIDILINNAGITHRSAFLDTDVAVYRRVMDVNYFGSLYCTKAALESLIQRQGMIITISSVAGFSPLYGRTGYSASKHALHGLFESLRTELKAQGVHVMIVCPGFTKTGIAVNALDGDGSLTNHPQSTVGRVATPDEVAESIFHAAEKNKRLLILSVVGRLTWLVTRMAPGLYEWIMARSLKSELER